MFKYLKRKYADQLLNEGGIRIGTLYGYRNMEETEANKGRADPLEGKSRDKLHIPYFNNNDFQSNQKLRDNVAHYVNLISGPVTYEFDNCTFSTDLHAPNYLIFCLSHEKSITVMQQFEGADTCVEIVKKEKFFDLITWELNRYFKTEFNFIGVARVQYGPFERFRSGIDSDPLDPVLAKTMKYEPQRELRAIWSIPKDVEITEAFYDLNIFGLNKCCRMIEI